MTDLFILTSLAVLAAWVAFSLVPFLAQRTAVYGIHGAREILYTIGEVGRVEETSLYRDLELVINYSLNTARSGGWLETALLLRELVREPKSPTERALRDLDAFVEALGEPPERALRQVHNAMGKVRVALMWRLVWASPLLWPVGLVITAVLVAAFVVVAAQLLGKAVRTAPAPAVPAEAPLGHAAPVVEVEPREVRESMLFRLLAPDERPAGIVTRAARVHALSRQSERRAQLAA